VPAAESKACHQCSLAINSVFVCAAGKLYHPNHFLCHHCQQPLGGKPYLERDGFFYCEPDFYAQFNPRCQKCSETIRGPFVSALGSSYHPHHFVCEANGCGKTFDSGSYRQHEVKAYCNECWSSLYAPQCFVCHQAITGAVFEALERRYHLVCFTCAHDGHAIGETDTFHVHNNDIFCKTHFESRFLHECSECHEIIRDAFVKVGEAFLHDCCWKCVGCAAQLRPEACHQAHGQFSCNACYDKEQALIAAPAAALPSLPSSSSSSSSSTSSSPLVENELRTVSISISAAAQRFSTPDSTSLASDQFQRKASLLVAQPASPLPLTIAELSLRPSSSSLSVSVAPMPPSESATFSLAVLKDSALRPATVDVLCKEQYLGEDEFVTVFGMDKTKFSTLAEWKRNEAKKKVGLF